MGDAVYAKVVNLKECQAQLARLDDAMAEEQLKAAVQAGALIIRNAAAERAPKKTRNLARSIHIEVIESNRVRVEVAIGTDLEYAAIHEFGGLILPKKAKFLAIPIGDLVGSPRLHDLNVATTRSGQYILVDQSGRAQYLLRRSVQIPARPYMRPAWDEHIDEAVGEMANVLKAGLERLLR